MNNGQLNEVSSKSDGIKDTLVYVPKYYDKNKKYPVICFHHGSGEAGTNLDKLYHQGLPFVYNDYIKNDKIGGTDLDKFIVVAIQHVASSGHSPNPVEFISYIFDILQHQLSLDLSRIYSTGLSAGAVQSSKCICEYPLFFAAAIPMSMGSGWINPTEFWNYKNGFAWFMQGNSDTSTRERAAKSDLNDINDRYPRHAIYSVYKGGHGNWINLYQPTYRWDESISSDDTVSPHGLSVYKWLLQFSLDSSIVEVPNDPEQPTEPDTPIPFIQPRAIITGGKVYNYDWSITTQVGTPVELSATGSTGTYDEVSWGITESTGAGYDIQKDFDKSTFTATEEGEYVVFCTIESTKYGYPSSDKIKIIVQ